MSRLFYHVMQDNAGNLLFDVAGTMRIAGTGTLATIYGDEALTIPIANPMANHPSFGSFKCFLGPGDYDFYLAKSGYTFEVLTGVQGSGTMADQNANNVIITGGVAQLVNLGMNHVPAVETRIWIDYLHASVAGITLHPADSDSGGSVPVHFVNFAGTTVGSIGTTGSGTAYNTTSDARLKRAITPLTGALDVVRRLRPVSFLWHADGSPGRGFLAGEVQEVVDGVVTGERDAVDDAGRIVPQQIDYSKLVPWLTAALQEAALQVQALTARVATLEDGLGV